MNQVRLHLDLTFAAALALSLAVLAVAFPDWRSPVRVALGVVGVFLLPGYALSAALFPGRGELVGFQRFGFTLALSVSSVSLLGLMLNYSPWGLRLVPISATLALATLIALGIGQVRRNNLHVGAAFSLPFQDRSFRIRALMWFAAVGTFAVLIGVAAVLRPEARFTEFYMLGEDGSLGGHPDSLVSGEPYALVFGIGNHEHDEEEYVIRGSTSVGGCIVLARAVLDPGARWEERRQLTAPEGNGPTRIPFHLYRRGDDQPYRSLQLVVELEAPGPDGMRE